MLQNLKLGYFTPDYTREAEVPETERTPRVRYRYKPLMMSELVELRQRLQRARDDTVALRINHDVIRHHVVWWDLERPKVANGKMVLDADGRPEMEPVDVTSADQLRFVVPFILDTIYGELTLPPTPIAPAADRDTPEAEPAPHSLGSLG